MTTRLGIKAKLRAEKDQGKQTSRLRSQGLLPGVLYGHKVQTVLVAVDKKEFQFLYSKAGGSTLVDLTIDDQKPKTVLVHDVQRHFLSSEPQHVDFYQVNMNEKIRARVPIIFSGEPKAVKDLGGILVKNISEVEVEALPADLPHSIEVDVSKLATFQDVIALAEMPVDHSKVKIFGKSEEIVAKVTPPRSEEELKALEEKPVEEVSQVEGVIKETPEAPTDEKETKSE